MEWRMVLNIFRGGYAVGFDANKLYQFKDALGNVSSFRLKDKSPYFNVHGLLYRDPFPNNIEGEKSVG